MSVLLCRVIDSPLAALLYFSCALVARSVHGASADARGRRAALQRACLHA